MGMINSYKNIILHDYFESLEGGGRLSSILAHGLDMDIGYGFAGKKHPFVKNLTKHSLNSHSFIPLWKQFKLARAFSEKTFFLKSYEIVVYSGFYTPLAINNHLNGKNILYCHTPPRFIYDQKEFYSKRLPAPLRPLLQIFSNYLQPRYENAVNNMDKIITNSENVSKRLQTYLGKQSTVIYPPCDTERFQWLDQNYYLSMGRLDPLKRVDLIVRAFLKMPDKKLVITSGGGELSSLKKLANQADNIYFTGWVNEQKLVELVGNSIATLYLAKDEDFGMSPVESMAAGKPVIGAAEGGLLETIIPSETGLLLKNPSVSAICEAVSTITPKIALNMRNDCEKQAHKFRTEVFIEKMREQFLILNS